LTVDGPGPATGDYTLSLSSPSCPSPKETDLALTKTDSPDPVAVGETLTYQLTVSNNGPDGATGLKVTNTDDPGGTLTYDIEAMAATMDPNDQPLTLNGQAPGARVSGAISLPARGSTPD